MNHQMAIVLEGGLISRVILDDLKGGVDIAVIDMDDVGTDDVEPDPRDTLVYMRELRDEEVVSDTEYLDQLFKLLRKSLYRVVFERGDIKQVFAIHARADTEDFAAQRALLALFKTYDELEDVRMELKSVTKCE